MGASINLGEFSHRGAGPESGRQKLVFSPDAPWLAPLAGFSDLPFRLLCRHFGAAVCCTEMVSAKGLVYGLQRKKGPDTATEDLLATCPQDAPLVVQLFGAEAEFLREAVTVLRGRGYTFFDLNMGCSVPKVTKTCAGSAMSKDIDNALVVAEAMVSAAGDGMVGFKIRLGWDATGENYLELAKKLEETGAAWITLHPRYAKQAFSGKAAWPALKKLVNHLHIPVIASGDLYCGADGVACVRETGVASVMFARGAIANPAVFAAYLKRLAGCSDGAFVSSALLEKQDVRMRIAAEEYLGGEALQQLILAHAALAREYLPQKTGKSGLTHALLKMRTAVPRYVRHLPGGKQLRQDLAHCSGWDELETILRSFFSKGQEGTAFPGNAD